MIYLFIYNKHICGLLTYCSNVYSVTSEANESMTCLKLIWGWNVRSIVNLELLMWEINFEDECLIPELKLSQQGNITMGYRKGMKFNLMSAKDGDQCLI